MSKVGKKSIQIPEGVGVDIEDGKIRVKGKRGEIEIPVLLGVEVRVEDKEIHLEAKGKRKQIRSNWGTLRSLIQNAVRGVADGFQKTLILEGVGFRVAKNGEVLELALGFSHPVKVEARKGIEFEVEKNVIRIKGVDKELVGQVAAEIRALKKPEPYKGKGLRYEGEVVRRKAGKKAAKTSK
ncbi:MAG: 50S ribosomal protein L6 [Nanoarchaeota archaeon]|nr:50S ribosomal protein L6 [Nanoarchaeota archaeon]